MTSRPDDGDDPVLADVLRRALARSAADVQPAGDGLTKIRVRTAAARRQRWLVPLAATTAAVVVGGGVAWAAGSLGDRDLPFAGGQTTAPISTGPADAGPIPPATDSADGTQPAVPTATVPIYYLGAQPRDGVDAYKVFREYHRVPAENVDDRTERVRIAVTEMFANEPLDDDYFGRWPATAAVLDTDVDVESGVVTVDLTGLDWTNVQMPDGRTVSAVGEPVVQQLVYTATAAASLITADDEFRASEVQLLVDGDPVDSVLGVETSDPLVRDAANHQAIVWITDPETGETVSSSVVVQLVANLYEGGPAQWELRRDGQLVDEGYTGDEPGSATTWDTYEFTIEDVPPGAYELTVYELGGRGEREFAPYDTKTFTVG